MRKILSRKQRRKQLRQGGVVDVVFSTWAPVLHPGGKMEMIKGKLRLRLADTVTREQTGWKTVRMWRNGEAVDLNPDYYP